MKKSRAVIPIILKLGLLLLPWLAVLFVVKAEGQKTEYIWAAIIFIGIVLQNIMLAFPIIKDIVNLIQKDKLLEHEILRIAYQKNGIVSENEAALLANITTSEAKEYLESLVKKGAAES